MRTKTDCFVLLIFALLLVCAACTPNAQRSSAAKRAEAWLRLLDSSKYTEAWDMTGDEFRENRTMQQWSKVLSASRNYKPAPGGRKIVSTTEDTTLNDLKKKGLYATVIVDTRSDSGLIWTEYVILMKDESGWKIIGHHFTKK